MPTNTFGNIDVGFGSLVGEIDSVRIWSKAQRGRSPEISAGLDVLFCPKHSIVKQTEVE